MLGGEAHDLFVVHHQHGSSSIQLAFRGLGLVYNLVRGGAKKHFERGPLTRLAINLERPVMRAHNAQARRISPAHGRRTLS